jgi:hypothetical protein
LIEECFPRSTDVPNQSPLYWVSHKDRYLRQLLIRDIERTTGRELLVYFTDMDNAQAQIDPGDDQFLFELLSARTKSETDLFIETPGGYTDTTEKLCALLKQMAPDLRVIVPRKAKSNGTLLALCAQEILMSATSELGPIDPSINGIPAEFIINDPSQSALMIQAATTAALQTKRLAQTLLTDGMMKGRPANDIDTTVETIATRQRFHSHGSVLDSQEATSLGFKINCYSPDDPLWKAIWLLRTMYAYDAPRNGHAKIFEGSHISSAVQIK